MPAMTWITRPAVGLLAGVVTVGALGALLMPGHYVPQPFFPNQDKVEHAALFATLCLLWRWAGVPAGRLFVCACALAALTEILQWMMGMGRTADVLDAGADAIGAALGIGAWTAVARGRRPRG